MSSAALKEQIGNIAAGILPEVIRIRRELHAMPELSKQEFKTSAFVAEQLSGMQIPFQQGVAGTGVVGLIECDHPGANVIAFRADMDALPLEEANDVEYRSVNPGIMHACGHDVHMAVLLGAARIINSLKKHLKGYVKLIFQPSEEQYPGGALPMINEGVLENPRVNKIFGLHVYPMLDAGQVGMRSGAYMASTDEFFLTVKGRGGHAATPELNIDPVVIAAHIILALQQITSRFASPVIPTVVSIGKIIANGKTNIIPDEVKMEGVVRTFDDVWRKEIHQKLTTVAQSIASGLGGSCEVVINHGYPALVNDMETTASVREFAIGLIGKNNVIDLPQRMTSEDFAYFAQQAPACFFRLGIRNQVKGITSNLHSSTFDIDEQSIETGMCLFAWIAANELTKD